MYDGERSATGTLDDGTCVTGRESLRSGVDARVKRMGSGIVDRRAMTPRAFALLVLWRYVELLCGGLASGKRDGGKMIFKCPQSAGSDLEM